MTQVEEKLKQIIRDCHDGKHQFNVIGSLSGTDGPGTATVIRWCVNCGSITVDMDHDNRTNPGAVLRLQSPELTRWADGGLFK